ncbi:Glucose-repressible protein Grg1 [Naviculisporaceae sp. PSN 640]
MDTIKNAANFVGDKVQSATSGASKEANKEVAKDNNQGVGTRLQAAGDAISDKTSEHKHDAKAEANKQAATH